MPRLGAGHPLDCRPVGGLEARPARPFVGTSRRDARYAGRLASDRDLGLTPIVAPAEVAADHRMATGTATTARSYEPTTGPRRLRSTGRIAWGSLTGTCSIAATITKGCLVPESQDC